MAFLRMLKCFPAKAPINVAVTHSYDPDIAEVHAPLRDGGSLVRLHAAQRLCSAPAAFLTRENSFGAFFESFPLRLERAGNDATPCAASLFRGSNDLLGFAA